MFRYFSKWEWILWLGSISVLLVSFWAFEGQSPFSFTASLIGVTALILCAKGNPIGQILMILFSLLYSFVSLEQRYYGEMVTYAGMSLPMSVISLIEWLRHPYKGDRAQVRVRRISKRECLLCSVLTLAVTAVFFFILREWGTAQLPASTLSVATSFAAVYLTFRRDPRFAFAYALNDVVLLALWIPAAWTNRKHLAVVLCFAVFLINDLYAFFNWLKMEKRQQSC